MIHVLPAWFGFRFGFRLVLCMANNGNAFNMFYLYLVFNKYQFLCLFQNRRYLLNVPILNDGQIIANGLKVNVSKIFTGPNFEK